ncbi:ATP/GTP-binding protein, partial [Streptomyces hyaluromycini]
LAPAARRGLAHLARMAGDFPTALATARALGWEGRHHRVEGDIWWPHGAMDRAAAAYTAARDEAEQHGVTGERGNSQAHLAFALGFTDPAAADNELALAEQLLASVDLRATTLITHIAALARDAGRTDADVDDRAQVLRTKIRTAGVTYLELALDLTLAFHHAVRDDHDQAAAAVARIQANTTGGDYAYYADIACYMADLTVQETAGAQWVDGAEVVRARWRDLVLTRRTHLEGGP